jgi:hypothetical protein
LLGGAPGNQAKPVFCSVFMGIGAVGAGRVGEKANDKFQNPNVKSMSNDKVQNIRHWAFGFDLIFEIWALTFPNNS